MGGYDIMDRLQTFALFALIQFALYFLATLNTRAIAKSKYIGMVASDVALCITSFILVREIGANGTDTYVALFGCIFGGVAGSCTALWLANMFWRDVK